MDEEEYSEESEELEEPADPKEQDETEESAKEDKPEKKGLFSRFKKKKKEKKPEEEKKPKFVEVNYGNMSIRYDSALVSRDEITKRNMTLYIGMTIAIALSILIPVFIIVPILSLMNYSDIAIMLWTIILSVSFAAVLMYFVYHLVFMQLPDHFEFIEWILRFGKNDIKTGYNKGELVVLARINGNWTRKHFEWFPEKIMHDEGVDVNADVFVTLDLTSKIPVFNVTNI